MSNPIAYAELQTKDAAAAKSFYGKLFDWKMSESETPKGPYTHFTPGEGVSGGIYQYGANGASHWIPYITVGDLVAATEKAKHLGAAALLENQVVPDMGRYSVLQDPTGARFGLWQEAAKPA
jgi:predicted enzyme related to lactoylglutathione lyase